MPTQAAPLVVNPSGQFLGNDGPWSSFIIDAGTPPQEMHVLVSTQVAATWVVAPNGCSLGDASNCTQARGGAYDTSKSSTWVLKDIYQLNEEVNLGYSGNSLNGTYGFDTLAISQPSGGAPVSVAHQVLADMVTERFYVGNIGLNAAPINFSASDPNDSALSLIASLKAQGSIPSESFGYTAGAFYRGGDGVNGSLTLGGFDASRFIPNDVSFTFAPAKTRQLVASVQSITYSDSKGQQPLTTGGILALVDSTVPYLWLPQTVCQTFEKTFGITWDPIVSLYTINDTVHSALVKENPSIVFEISNSLTGGPSVNITLPYASFDLNASYPVTKNQQRYFPLQRAADENSFTLGRTFFQEAFLIVNYENSTFSISQAVHDSNTPSHIVAIGASGSTGLSPSPSSTAALTSISSGGSSGIGPGAIAGIVIAFILLALISGGFFFCWRRHQRKPKEMPAEGINAGKASPTSEQRGSILSHDDSAYQDQSNPIIPMAEAEVQSTSSPLTGNGIIINEFYQPTSGSPLKLPELAGDKPPRSELSSPEQPSTPTPAELPSPDLQDPRSELSTPEPLYSEQELPTPDPSHELRAERSLRKKPEPPTNRGSQALPSRFASSQAIPSPDMVSATIISPIIPPPFVAPEELPSPLVSIRTNHSASDSDSDSRLVLSGLNSPTLPLQRPTSLRVDSSGSEAPYTRGGLPTRAFSAQGRYHRQNSSSSDIPTISNFAERPARPRRGDTNGSDQSDVSQMSPTIASRPQLARVFPSGSASFVAVRPPHNRTLSQGDTWETRLEQNSASEGEEPRADRRATRNEANSRNPERRTDGNDHQEQERGSEDVADTTGPASDRNGFAVRDTSIPQPRTHRRVVSEEEQRIREGLIGGGVLRQSQTEPDRDS